MRSSFVHIPILGDSDSHNRWAISGDPVRMALVARTASGAALFCLPPVVFEHLAIVEGAAGASVRLTVFRFRTRLRIDHAE